MFVQGISENFLARASDQLVLVNELLREADRLKSENTLTSKIAAFSILTQWIETNLTTLIYVLVNSTTRGEIKGFEIVNNAWQKDAKYPRTLGQKSEFLNKYSVGNGKIDELKTLKSAIRGFVELRNDLTHDIFEIHYDRKDSHKKKLNDDLNKAIRKADDIIEEQYRITKLLFGDLSEEKK